MGKPTEFKLNGDSDYTLWNGQTAFSGMTNKPRLSILREPAATQAIAVTWDKTTKAFTSVFFELIQEGNEQIAAAGTTGQRIAGKFKGSDLFIISLPGKQLPADLRENLTQWVETKYLFDNEGSQQKQKRRERSITIGALCLEIEKHIGKWEVTPKPAAPAVIQEPAQPARPPERPTSILGGAAREIGERPVEAPPQAYVSGQNLDDQQYAGDENQLPYAGTLKRDFDPEKGFTFIEPDRAIPGVERDVFVHFTRVPEGITLNGGDRVRFSTRIHRGNVQVDQIEPFGMRRAPAVERDVAERDPRSLPPIAEADLRGEDFVAQEEARTERRGKVIIDEIPIRTPFGTEVVPGGAWRKASRDPN